MSARQAGIPQPVNPDDTAAGATATTNPTARAAVVHAGDADFADWSVSSFHAVCIRWVVCNVV